MTMRIDSDTPTLSVIRAQPCAMLRSCMTNNPQPAGLNRVESVSEENNRAVQGKEKRA